jgi:hypothetical protein
MEADPEETLSLCERRSLTVRSSLAALTSPLRAKIARSGSLILGRLFLQRAPPLQLASTAHACSSSHSWTTLVSFQLGSELGHSESWRCSELKEMTDDVWAGCVAIDPILYPFYDENTSILFVWGKGTLSPARPLRFGLAIGRPLHSFCWVPTIYNVPSLCQSS